MYQVDRLYVWRKGGRILVSIQNSVDVSIQRLKDYIKKSAREDWLQGLEKIQTTQTSNDQKNAENKNGKNNNWIDITCGKQSNSYTRKFRHD